MMTGIVMIGGALVLWGLAYRLGEWVAAEPDPSDRPDLRDGGAA